MGIGDAVFGAGYLAVLAYYVRHETVRPSKEHALSKILLASLYLGYALCWQLRCGGEPPLLLISLAFFWLGDVVLIWHFRLGGFFFWAGNIVMCGYELGYLPAHSLPLGSNLGIAALAFAASFGGFVLIARNWGVPKKQRLIGLVYVVSAALQGALGAMVMAAAKSAPAAALGSGSLLFMLSDFVLAAHLFRYRDDRVLITNSVLYFIGMLLIAISISLH